jgi:hypothetical protein
MRSLSAQASGHLRKNVWRAALAFLPPLYAIGSTVTWDATSRVDSDIVRRTIAGASEIVYDASTDPYVMWEGGAKLLTGP